MWCVWTYCISVCLSSVASDNVPLLVGDYHLLHVSPYYTVHIPVWKCGRTVEEFYKSVRWNVRKFYISVLPSRLRAYHRMSFRKVKVIVTFIVNSLLRYYSGIFYKYTSLHTEKFKKDGCYLKENRPKENLGHIDIYVESCSCIYHALGIWINIIIWPDCCFWKKWQQMIVLKIY